MKNDLIALLLACSMALSLAACGAKETAPEAPAASSTVESVEIPDTSAEVEEPASSEEETPAEPGAEGPSAPVVEEQNPAVQAPQPETPAEPVVDPAPQVPVEPEQSVEAPAESSSGVDLAAFYEALAANGGENWPSMMGASDAETLAAFYPGIEAVATKQAAMYMPMISAVAAEFMLVEVENEADVQTVKDILQERINYQVGDDTNPGGAWYPETIENWKTNARIVSNGRYVMLAVYPENVDGIVEQFNGLF